MLMRVDSQTWWTSRGQQQFASLVLGVSACSPIMVTSALHNDSRYIRWSSVFAKFHPLIHWVDILSCLPRDVYAGIWPSVCLSVCHKPVFCQNGSSRSGRSIVPSDVGLMMQRICVKIHSGVQNTLEVGKSCGYRQAVFHKHVQY